MRRNARDGGGVSGRIRGSGLLHHQQTPHVQPRGQEKGEKEGDPTHGRGFDAFIARML